MKQIFIKGVLGLAVTAGIYLLVFFALTQVELSGRPAIYWTSDVLFPKGGHAYQRFHEYDPEHQYDALIMGSSHAYRGYDPRLFEAAGIDVFNLGSSSQTMLQTYYLAEAYARPEICEYVILDLYESALIGDGMESTADLSQNLPNDRLANNILWAQADIRGLNMWTLRQMMYREGASYQSDNYISGGFVMRTDSAGELPAYHEKEGYRFNQLCYLQKIIDLCERRNVTLVLVNSPLPSDYQQIGYDHFHELGMVYSEIYLDYRSSLPLEDENHFYDQHHLNQAGVEIFNKNLIDALLD